MNRWFGYLALLVFSPALAAAQDSTAAARPKPAQDSAAAVRTAPAPEAATAVLAAPAVTLSLQEALDQARRAAAG